LSELNPNRL